jgi:hypothetical protein
VRTVFYIYAIGSRLRFFFSIYDSWMKSILV